MKNKKNMKDKFQLKNKRFLVSLASILLVGAVWFTIAYQTAETDPVTNEFETPEIETFIEETFDGVTKTNVTATNSEDSDVDVYVRLKFVVQTLEAVYASDGNVVMSDGTYYYSSTTITDDSGTRISLVSMVSVTENDDGTYTYTTDGVTPTGVDTSELYYVTGAIVATPSSYDDNGYLLNLPITIVNVLDVEGLNVDFSGNGNADWFTDATQSTGIYFYKYSLAPGESAYDLATEINQEVYYEETIVRLTVLVDSVQVDGVEDAWINVNQSETFIDANGNPILYSSTYEDGATGVLPQYNRVAVDNQEDVSKVENDYGYIQRFNTTDEDDTYDTTLGVDSYLKTLSTETSTVTLE